MRHYLLLAESVPELGKENTDELPVLTVFLVWGESKGSFVKVKINLVKKKLMKML